MVAALEVKPYNKFVLSQPAVAGTASTPLVPRSVTAAPNKGVISKRVFNLCLAN